MTEVALSQKSSPSPATFVWEDPFLLEDQLDEDERLIRDSAKALECAETQRIRKAPSTQFAGDAMGSRLGIIIPLKRHTLSRGLQELDLERLTGIRRIL